MTTATFEEAVYMLPYYPNKFIKNCEKYSLHISISGYVDNQTRILVEMAGTIVTLTNYKNLGSKSPDFLHEFKIFAAEKNFVKIRMSK
jgi:phosphoribosylformylglycinamidine (FGAM) synthase-like enzyme